MIQSMTPYRLHLSQYYSFPWPGGSSVKNLHENAGDLRDVGLIPGSGRSPRGGHGDLLLYSCLENPMDRGAWRAIAQGVTESDTTKVT